MGRVLDHEQAAELLAVYALDAVDADESEDLAAHLATCDRCRRELDAYREVAAFLANDGGDAPAQLWDRISQRIVPWSDAAPATHSTTPAWLASLPRPAGAEAGARGARPARESEPGPSPFVRPGRRPAARATARPWGARPAVRVLAAAAAVALIVLGVQVARLDHRVSGLSASRPTASTSAAFDAAMANPSARRITLDRADGRRAALVVVLPSGQAYLDNEDLPALPSSKTYQLWAMKPGLTVSLGVLGAHPSAEALTMDRTASGEELGLTVEPSGGATAPTEAPLATS